MSKFPTSSVLVSSILETFGNLSFHLVHLATFPVIYYCKRCGNDAFKRQDITCTLPFDKPRMIAKSSLTLNTGICMQWAKTEHANTLLSVPDYKKVKSFRNCGSFRFQPVLRNFHHASLLLFVLLMLAIIYIMTYPIYPLHTLQVYWASHSSHIYSVLAASIMLLAIDSLSMLLTQLFYSSNRNTSRNWKTKLK